MGKKSEEAERSKVWTYGEQKCFLEALEKYGHEDSGKEWSKIAQHIGTRSIREVREHAGRYFVQLQEVQLHQPVNKRSKAVAPAKSGKPSDALWSAHENFVFENSLAAYSETSTKRWNQIAAFIPSKSANDVRHRYQKLAHDISRIEAGDHVTLMFKSPNTQVAPKYPTLTSAEGNLLREALRDIHPSQHEKESINTAVSLISSGSRAKANRRPSFSKSSARNAVQAALQSARSESPAILDALVSALEINT